MIASVRVASTCLPTQRVLLVRRPSPAGGVVASASLGMQLATVADLVNSAAADGASADVATPLGACPGAAVSCETLERSFWDTSRAPFGASSIRSG